MIFNTNRFKDKKARYFKAKMKIIKVKAHSNKMIFLFRNMMMKSKILQYLKKYQNQKRNPNKQIRKEKKI